jgi:hypothetical protein
MNSSIFAIYNIFFCNFVERIEQLANEPRGCLGCIGTGLSKFAHGPILRPRPGLALHTVVVVGVRTHTHGSIAYLYAIIAMYLSDS